MPGKKSESDIEKMVNAQAKRKSGVGRRADQKPPTGRELDKRASKGPGGHHPS
jgi:hypothetical protein